MSRLPDWIEEADARIREAEHRIETQRATVDGLRSDGQGTTEALHRLQSLHVTLAQLQLHRDMLQREMAARHHLTSKLQLG